MCVSYCYFWDNEHIAKASNLRTCEWVPHVFLSMITLSLYIFPRIRFCLQWFARIWSDNSSLTEGNVLWIWESLSAKFMLRELERWISGRLYARFNYFDPVVQMAVWIGWWLVADFSCMTLVRRFFPSFSRSPYLYIFFRASKWIESPVTSYGLTY